MADLTTAFGTNPFTLLSLIAAPAVLTNAASLLVLSTRNRFAHASISEEAELLSQRLGHLDPSVHAKVQS